MQHFYAKAIVLAALSVPLGACSSFLGINFARHAPRAAPDAALAAKTQSATSAGRQQLADGSPGLAIEAFQRALASGEPVGPAVNGMGVAYARIARFDLAQRYFEQAAASDPANPQYADNLVRLMRSPAFALRREGDIARAALQAAARDEAVAKIAEARKVAPALGQLQRVSRGEVRIASAAPQVAPTVRGQVPVGKNFRPLIRITFADRPVAPGTPIRIVQPETKTAVAAPTPADTVSVTAGARH